MSTEGTDAQLVRIKKALDRIEAAATRPTSPSADNGAMTTLQHKHDELRAETTIALASLDAIINRMSQSEDPS
jgi:hypothetical protein